VFTVDHQVKVFTAVANGPEPPGDFEEAPSCDGPFRVGSSICAAMTSPTSFVPVNALAWDGCPN